MKGPSVRRESCRILAPHAMALWLMGRGAGNRLAEGKAIRQIVTP